MTPLSEKSRKICRILIIEDDRFIHQGLQHALENIDCEVSVAVNGEEGLQKIREERPDFVFLDIILPIIDGFEVLKEAKGDPTTKHIPIVIFSNLGQESDIARGKELGALDYLIKSNLAIKDIIQKFHTYLPPHSP